MKKIISALTLLSILASIAAYAAPSLDKDYIFSDGEYLYTFGYFDKSEDVDEVGVSIGGTNYKLDDSKLQSAKANGKFGIGIKDAGNTLGDSYSLTPYTKKGDEVTYGEPLTVAKYEPVRNLRYHGPADENTDTVPVLKDNFGTGTQIYTNVAVYSADNVHSLLKGDQYIFSFNPSSSTVSTEVKNAWSNGAVQEWISFDLYESATVRVFTKDNYTMADTGLLNSKYGFTRNTTDENNGYYFSLLHSDYPTAEQTPFPYMFTKTVEIEEGGYERVSIPNLTTYGGLSHWGYFIVIDYAGDEEISPEITNVKYAGPEVEGVTYNVELKANITEDAEKTVYANNTAVTFADVDASIEGNPYIITDDVKGSTYNSEIASYWYGSARDWISFDINSDAVIKVIADGDTLKNCSNYGFAKADEMTYFNGYLAEYGTVHTAYTTMYYKNVEVEPGETVTVTIPNAPTWTTQSTCKRAHVVVVDFERDYTPPEITPAVTDIAYAGPEAEGVTYKVQLNESLGTGNPAYTNRDNLISFVDSSVQGLPYITMDAVKGSTYDSTIGSAWFGSATDWVTFKINKSARIKVITDGDTLKNCTNYGFTKAEEEKVYLTAATDYSVMYYKDIEVEYGKTVSVTIPNAPTWTTQETCRWPHIVVIDFEE